MFFSNMSCRIEKSHWILTKPIAHRGLHSKNLPENGIGAFGAAIENGYPIETDVQLTLDNKLVCFHDDNLKRVTGKDAFIRDKTLAEIKELSLADSAEKIPTFDEFLKFVDGRTPILIEIKTQKTKNVIVDEVIKRLDCYRGEFAVQSFDPLIMREVRKKRPKYLRGQLVDKGRHKNVSLVVDKLLSVAFFNFTVKPDFMNMNVQYLPVSKRMQKNKRVICWTVRNQYDEKKALQYADNYIFESMIPSKNTK